MGKLSGKTAIITGASAGFGRGTAYAFAAEGCNLVLTARRTEQLEEAVQKCKELGANAVFYAGDAREEQTAVSTVQDLSSPGRVHEGLQNLEYSHRNDEEHMEASTQEQSELSL